MSDYTHGERDFPVVVPGTKVVIQLKDRKYWQADEAGNPDPDTIQYLRTDPEIKVVNDHEGCYAPDWADKYNALEDAMHVETICTECIADWSQDYYITLADDQS